MLGSIAPALNLRNSRKKLLFKFSSFVFVKPVSRSGIFGATDNFSTPYAAAEDNPDAIIVFAFIRVDLRQLLSSGLSSITRVQSAILKERVLKITHPRS